jgi:hypothetical protein
MNLTAVFQFAKGALSGTTPQGAPNPSSSRLLAAVVVACGCGWLTGDLIVEGMTGNWVLAFGALLSAVTTGYTVGKFADRPPPPAS